MANQSYAQIWQTVQQVPAGKVATYGQVADLAGLPGRARLVGKALGKTPSSMEVPWYRIINSQGRISFPIGTEHFDRQSALLQEEGVVILNGRIRLSEFQWQPSLSDLLMKLNF